jgi:hypothetical protein
MGRTIICGKEGCLLFFGKGQLLWDVMENTTYAHPINFLALGSRDMHDANSKAVDYLFCALCQFEFA